jgi:3-oxoacyl-[acyl-carrier-protein] synthase III
MAEYYNQKAVTVEQAILRWFLSDGAGALVLSSKKPDRPCLQIVDTYLESVGVGIEPSMRLMVGSNNPRPLDFYEKGSHHLTQDFQVVSKLAPDLFKEGMEAMTEKTQLDLNTVKCFFANIPTKHLMDEAKKRLRYEKFNNPDLPFYTPLAIRGYPGAPAVVISLDEYMKEVELQIGDRIASFVTESSKWMHAGFIMEYC